MSGPPSFELPPGAGGFETLVLEDDPAVSWARFDSRGAESLLSQLRDSAELLAGYPVIELARVLGSVGSRFLDPEDPLRKEAEARVPDEAALSRRVASDTIQGMARDWTHERLERMIAAEFPDPAVLDGFGPRVDGNLLHAVGGSLAFHIASGNVPGVGATSLVRSLLVKTPVLLKPGRGDIALPCLFARGLAESDPELARAVAVVYWPHAEGGPLEELALRNADRIVAYGSNSFLRRLRDHLPVTTPFVAYHHRLSIGAVGSDTLGNREDAEAIATEVAESIAAFDNRGCVSARIIWVEQGGQIDALEWAELLAERLEEMESRSPSGPLDPSAAASLQQQRGIAELRKAEGRGTRSFGGQGRAWSVFFEPENHGEIVLPDQGRSVLVRPIGRLAELPGVLPGGAAVLQSLAVASSETRRRELADQLALSGITRVTTFSRLPWPPAWWRHDGLGPLSALVRWVSLESGS